MNTQIDINKLFDYMVTSLLKMPQEDQERFIRIHLEIFAEASEIEREKLLRWMLDSHQRLSQESRDTMNRLFQKILAKLPEEKSSKILNTITKVMPQISSK